MKVSLHRSFAFNASYAVFQLCLGLWHSSMWFYALSGYELLPAIMHLMLANSARRHTPGEEKKGKWKKYWLCGALLLLMNLVLAAMIACFIWKVRTYRRHEITTIAMAVYTFAALVLAIT